MSTDTNSEATAGEQGINYLTLTFALMGGATVWLLRLIINSALVQQSCAMGATWPLWLTTGITTLIGVAALAYSWRFYRMGDDEDGAAETARWLGLLGILFNVSAIVGILFESVPIAVLDVCRSATLT